MSENEYLLPLTERELGILINSVDWMRSMPAVSRTPSYCEEYQAVYDKLRALEPIGTGGTTEGA